VHGVKTRFLLILALAAVPAAQAAYKCKDEKGLTHIGDTPPAGCANVPMYEITRSGTVIRKIDPTPTGDQLKAKQEEEARAKEAAKAAAEQRRKDVALLATYSTEKDIDTSRDLNLKPIEGRIASAKERTAAVEKREKELEGEMEFYKAGKSGKSSKVREAPAQLKADLERTRQEKVTLAKSIAEYEKEMQEVRERYDADKKRWVELKQMHREGKLDLRDPKELEQSKKGLASKPGVKKYELYIIPAN
jgi:chromosome segregation ATPase